MTTEQEKKDMLEAAERMLQAIRELHNMARMLRAKVKPGHCDYISKARAAEWADEIAATLES